jgi:hypothetical protein
VSEQSHSPAGAGISYSDLTQSGEDSVQSMASRMPDTPGIVDISAVGVNLPERVDFGIDALGQWCIEVRAQDGTLLEASEEHGSRHGLDLAAYPVDSPAGAVALQEALKKRYQPAEIVWRPGVMNSADEQRALAHRVLAAAAADRQTAIKATEMAETSLRAALEKARAVGIGPGEMAQRTGYARSTIAKALRNLGTSQGSAAVLPPTAPQE